MDWAEQMKNTISNILHLTGYVDKAMYTKYLLATDIGINLRVKFSPAEA